MYVDDPYGEGPQDHKKSLAPELVRSGLAAVIAAKTGMGFGAARGVVGAGDKLGGKAYAEAEGGDEDESLLDQLIK